MNGATKAAKTVSVSARNNGIVAFPGADALAHLTLAGLATETSDVDGAIEYRGVDLGRPWTVRAGTRAYLGR